MKITIYESVSKFLIASGLWYANLFLNLGFSSNEKITNHLFALKTLRLLKTSLRLRNPHETCFLQITAFSDELSKATL